MRRLVIALAAVAVLGATAGIVVAATATTDTYACYDTRTGALSVDLTGKGCRGKAGTFTFGTTTRLVTAESEPLPAGDYRAAFAACAAGEVVLSGGFVMPTINPLVQPFEDTPAEIDGTQGWYVVVINGTSGPQPAFSVSAVCAPGTSTGY